MIIDQTPNVCSSDSFCDSYNAVKMYKSATDVYINVYVNMHGMFYIFFFWTGVTSCRPVSYSVLKEKQKNLRKKHVLKQC